MTITCSICSASTEFTDSLTELHLHHITLFQIDPQSTSELILGLEEWARDLAFVTRITNLYPLDHIFFLFDDATLCVNCGIAQYKELKLLLTELRNFQGS